MTTTTETTSDSALATPAAQSRSRRWRAIFDHPLRVYYSLAEHLFLAAIAYVPLLSVKQGLVTSDTKTYLYLDPSRFLHQVTSMWDPSVGLGTVTHEYIGYLFPMGPFYWFFSAVGAPVWVAQRLWLGSILFAAGAGTLFLARTLNLRSPGRTVAATAFMLSPYVLQYSARISVILLPWAGLPFMVVFAVRAVRKGGWRYPALFALVVAATSGINASSIIYVGVAPVLWIIFAVAVLRESTWQNALTAAAKMGALTVLTCLWWIAGLAVEAGYGVDVLRYTETLPATTETSSAAEVIRGLGYWYFYGIDRLGPWTQSAVIYTQQLWLIAVSYAVPVLSFVSAVFVRWRYRAYFILLVVVGMVLSVGAHPISNPTPVGRVLKQFMSQTTAGFALRSTDRATPLVILGLAMLLGAGVSAIRLRRPILSGAIAFAALGVVIANNPALFNGDAEVASFFTQPAKLPSYETAAVTHLNSENKSYRVLAIPGNDFASFRWGDTVDAPLPAALNRPFVTREQQVMGSIATADTLFAMDDPIQQGTEQWNSLSQLARLMSAGDVIVQYDQRYEHYGTPDPQVLAQQLQMTPEGLSNPVSYGHPRPNVPSYPDIDGQTLSNVGPLPLTAPLVSYTVQNPRPITRAEADVGAVLVAGDATGLQELADAGLLNTSSAVYYAGTLDKSPAQMKQLLRDGGALVVTDTNRKQAFRWDTISTNYGETETPSQNAATSDPSDSPINLFPGAPADSKSTASYVGAVNVTASSSGSALAYTPEDRPFAAVDGNLDTSWDTGGFQSDPSGQWWQIKFQQSVNANHLTLVQPQNGVRLRWINRVTLRFDGSHPISVRLGPSSRATSGQVVTFPDRTFHTLRVTIDSTTNDRMSTTTATAVGFSEVEIPGQQVQEVIKMPSDLLDSAGKSSLNNRLTVLMTRQRVSSYSFPVRSDPETTISREFYLPTARTFSLSGTASLSALIPDDQIDELIGRPITGPNAVDAFSKARLPGDLKASASAAADGNPATAWQPGFGDANQEGEWLQYDLPKSITFNHLTLQVVADRRHSVPTALTITSGSDSRVLALPAISDGATPGATVSVPLNFAAITGRDIRITITGVRLERSTNFYAPSPIALPLGIAEVGIPGVNVAAPPASLPGDCQSNLITIDGKPVSVRVTGPTSTALDGGEVSLVPCGGDGSGVSLSAGSHVVETAVGHSPSTGWNVDQIALDSAPGGNAAFPTIYGALPATQPGAQPSVRVLNQSRSGEQVNVANARSPFELVLGQSSNSGWSAIATTAGHSVDLGTPQLVDGFANGWQVSDADLARLGSASGDFTVSIDWTPQRSVSVALLISAAAAVLCLALALVPSRRRLLTRLLVAFVGIVPRRRRPRHGSNSKDRSAADLMRTSTSPSWTFKVVTAAEPAEDEAPVLSSPFDSRGQRPRLWVIALTSIAAGIVAAGIASPAVGAAALVATAASLSLRWMRGALTVGAVGLLIAAAVSVVAGQALHALPESSNWPSAYQTAGLLVWMAVVALGADALVFVVRGRRPAHSEPRPPPPG